MNNYNYFIYKMGNNQPCRVAFVGNVPRIGDEVYLTDRYVPLMVVKSVRWNLSEYCTSSADIELEPKPGGE